MADLFSVLLYKAEYAGYKEQGLHVPKKLVTNLRPIEKDAL